MENGQSWWCSVEIAGNRRSRYSFRILDFAKKYDNPIFFFFFCYFTAIKQKELAIIYWNAEQECRQFNKKMTAFVIFQQTSFIIALLFSIYCISIGNYDTSKYFLPLRVAAPFNIDSLFRWYLFYVLQLTFGFSYILSVISATSYFVCCCFYLNALCDHFDYLIELVEAECDQNHSQSNERAAIYKSSPNLRKLLSNTVDHHNKIYE